MTDPRIQLRVQDGVATLVLADAPRRNALDLALADALAARIQVLAADPAVAALVVTGQAPAFCAGADLGVLQQVAALPAEAAGKTQRLALLRRLYAPFLALRACAKPTLAAVDGAAVGAGLNLALAADVTLATPRAVFMTGFDRLGLHPGGGCTAMLNARVGPQAAAAMLLYGQRLDGVAAERVGLAFACVSADELMARAQEMASRAAASVSRMIEATKATLARTAPADLDVLVEHELQAQAESTTWPETQARIDAAVVARGL